MKHAKPRSRAVALCVAVVLATLAIYWPVRSFDFIDYDDIDFITSNPHVQKGITSDGIVWAFTDSSSDWWHPLTWLSHMLDVELFGMNPGPHHLTNLALHVADTLLLFAALTRMTGAMWRSWFVAALFALHPLHVESVAWVAERKDVLSTFFWMLALLAYCRYAERPCASRYLLTLFVFMLGLMAKPMLVTLPFVFLLLDYWPLRRMNLAGDRPGRHAALLVWEKLPFLVLAAASCALTYVGQERVGRITPVAELSLGARLANAMLSYASYLVKMIWPQHLAVFYPYPNPLPASQVIAAALMLMAISVLTIRLVRQQPYLVVGWLWYLGTLVPVIGLVQVGGRAMADRFTYVSLIGAFIMLAWGVPELWRRLHVSFVSPPDLAVGALVACSVATFFQLRHWRSSITIFEHALAVTDGNYIAHNNLGVALMRMGRENEAVVHLQQALSLWPEYPEANKSLADVLARVGRTDEAVRYYDRALHGRPDWPDAENNLGLALARQGQLDEAIAHFSRALRLDPQSETVYVNLGLAYLKLKHRALALTLLSHAVALEPADAQAHYLIGQVLEEEGKMVEACEHLNLAAQLDPRLAAARHTFEQRPPGKAP